MNLPQGGEGVRVVLEGCYKDVEGCYKGITRMLRWWQNGVREDSGLPSRMLTATLSEAVLLIAAPIHLTIVG
jgi:hypothetical protein